jgi:hypothetical protein
MMQPDYEAIGKTIGTAAAQIRGEFGEKLSETEERVLAVVNGLLKNIKDTIQNQDEELDLLHNKIDELPTPKDGEPGKDGKDGIDGQDRPIVEPVFLTESKTYPKGTNGIHRNSLWVATRDANDNPDKDPSAWTCLLEGFDSVKCHYLGSQQFEIVVKGSNGTEHITEFMIPHPIHKGVWEEGTYYPGHIVTKGAAMFQALKETAESPPGGAWEQILVAPRGGRGPSGKDGKDGKDATIDQKKEKLLAELMERIEILEAIANG